MLGADRNNPTTIVDIHAPVSGVITDQQVRPLPACRGFPRRIRSPSPICRHVWILCDVYENDLKQVRLGEFADVRLNAYPDRVFQGRISNIGPILDPNMRTAKVRLEMRTPA